MRSGTRSTSNARQNSSGGQPLPHQVGDCRPRKLQSRHAQPAVHQQRAQHCRHREPEYDVAQRPRGVLNAAHPAVARRRDQDGGHADDRDPHPRQCRRRDVTACGQRRDQRYSRDLDQHHDQRAQSDREPGGLDPLTDRRRTIAGAEETRRARGGAVGQKRHLRAQCAQDQPADGQTGQADRTQTPDHRQVEQQVDGFGGKHSERGQRQPGNAAAGRLRDRNIARRLSQGLRTGPARRRRPTRTPNSRRPAGARRRRRRWRSRRGPSTWPASKPTSARARSP